MKLHLPLSNTRHASIISAYAPTLISTEETIERFYANLNSILHSVPANDKLILLGDFSAHVGCDRSRWKGVLSKHGVGKMNSNGFLLLSKCAEYELLVMNIVLVCLPVYKTT